ncbi:hypothetical protein F0562_013082 [Nyssa sinensis]|uniref:NAC domain-containing protein n=1 Tax=Nyssa sinensis TaxID=561372 RepID=A0A5J4ZZM9_9ASTE|nr:hypothetical protein F0562_013082 [Nyssa sinensis]
MKLLDSSPCLGDGNVWPPGFRFHPTDEELVLYYLKRRICRRRLKLDIIGETDVYKWDPEDLPGQSKLKTGDRQWFFFSPRDRKYPNGARSNRATRHGYWKATGKDRTIAYNSRSVGLKKTLVFYRGRAPTGERTDWVMHEYTVDEEELKRCQAVQDYYALYKVYKKSGPGPKNGEQYGAPFKEEDWADEEHSNVNGTALLKNSVKQVDAVASVNNVRANCQVQSPLNDLEEFMNQIVDDEPLFVQSFTVDPAYSLQHLVGEEETQSNMVDPPLKEANLPEQGLVLHPSSQQYGVQASLDLSRSDTYKLQCYEAPEVISAPNICEQEPHVTEEDFLKDFLEMDDLIGPEPAIQNIENPVENLQFEEIDGMSELDLYHDAAMFIHDIGPVDLSSISLPYLNNLENEMANPVSYSYLNNLGNGAVSHPYLYNLENDKGSVVDSELQPCSDDANGNSSPLWVHDQNNDVFTPAESEQGTITQPSGVLYAGNSASPSLGGNQNPSNQADDGTQSWVSSSLWSFLESIPTNPASASENALVNRAFERMSSFSRVRINAGNRNAAAGNPTATMGRSSKYNRGFFYFSVLGMVCAILWVLMGTSVKVLEGFISF